MTYEYFRPLDKRITIVTGHYGSGKTEFSVNLAMLLKKSDPVYSRTALIDLDIANPYFRSRERRDMLEAEGIPVYGSMYKTEITAELPALSPAIRAPLEDEGCRVIIDAGGNDSGALVLNQFGKYFTDGSSLTLAVVNKNRPETRDLQGALEHLQAIENVTGLKISGIVNNTHLLRETSASDIVAGHEFCQELCEKTKRTLFCDCYPQPVVKRESIPLTNTYFMPLMLYMRPTWLDR